MRLRTAIAAGLMVCLSTVTAKAENVNILFNNFVPPTFFLYTVFPEWAQEIEAATEGRVTMTIPAKSLAPPPEQWNGVEQGIFDGAWQFNGFLANRIHLPMVAMLPWTSGEDSVATSVALWRTYEEFFADAGEYEGLKLVGLFSLSGSDFYSQTDMPITSMSELGSRKVWALPGAAAVAAKASGAGVVSSPATKVHEYVSRNVTSAFLGISKDGAQSYKVAPYTKSITLFPRKVLSPSFSVFIRQDIWDKISDEDQAAIMAVSGEALARKIGERYTALEAKARQKFMDAGVAFVDASPEFYADIQAATAHIQDAWLTKANEMGIDAQAALDFYNAEVSRIESGS